MTILDSVQWRTRLAPAWQVGALTIIPEARSLVVNMPNGAWVWNTPVALLVQDADGHTQRIPIVDVTRGALLGLAAINVLLWLATIRSVLHKGKNHHG